MNHASEHDIDRLLTALRDTEPTAGLESRILQSLENRTPARSSWFRWTASMQWGTAALATAAIVLAITLTTRNTQHPTPTIARSTLPTPIPALAPTPKKYVILSAAKDPLLAHTRTNPQPPPHQLLCDCDPLALAETQAPSHPAPEMPMTAQERLLQRVVRHDDPIEIAELGPLPTNPLQAAVTAKEDDAVKNVVQHFLKQLAAAEAIDPTAPNPTPTPTSDANDPGPPIESPSSPN